MLVAGEIDVDRGEEAKLVNMYINVKESDMTGADGPGKLDMIVTVEVLKKKRSDSWPWVHNKKTSSVILPISESLPLDFL